MKRKKKKHDIDVDKHSIEYRDRMIGFHDFHTCKHNKFKTQTTRWFIINEILSIVIAVGTGVQLFHTLLLNKGEWGVTEWIMTGVAVAAAVHLFTRALEAFFKDAVKSRHHEIAADIYLYLSELVTYPTQRPDEDKLWFHYNTLRFARYVTAHLQLESKTKKGG